jgi:hypothetical protein
MRSERFHRLVSMYDAAFTATFTRRFTRWQLLTFAVRALLSPRDSYAFTFIGPDGRPNPVADEVLADLRSYCGIHKGGIVVSPVTRTADPIATAYRAGQRDVFLRIAGFIGLDEAQLQEKPHVRTESSVEG